VIFNSLLKFLNSELVSGAFTNPILPPPKGTSHKGYNPSGKSFIGGKEKLYSLDIVLILSELWEGYKVLAGLCLLLLYLAQDHPQG
jgi:hypothetical protein